MTLERIINSFYLIDYGSFFINIVLQSSSFIVLTDLNRVVELLDSGFSFTVAHLFRLGYKNERFKSKEVNSFKIGYNYAESAAIGVMVLFIGLYSPLLFVCGSLFYFFTLRRRLSRLDLGCLQTRLASVAGKNINII